MDDSLIKRQAAIDAIKRNTFRLTFAQERNCEGHVAWSTEAVYSDVMENELLELPSARPETITCNQCVYYQQNHHYCEFLDAEFSPSDYCSQAERREE